ncbi:MAG TPA: helix-turn-helix domain-containing protein [Dehalococcoidia bacterium]|nr:helix-turn-helix domain-containing protein [Dehalococcoidia bacterium]
MQPGARIDYKTLRRINPEAARQAVLEYLASCGHNITETARVFGITRPVVYDILAKQRTGDLRDRSRAPSWQPRKTSPTLEDQVVAAKNLTRLGPKRLSLYLARYEDLQLSWATIRHILRRNRHRLSAPPGARQRRPRLVVLAGSEDLLLAEHALPHVALLSLYPTGGLS